MIRNDICCSILNGSGEEAAHSREIGGEVLTNKTIFPRVWLTWPCVDFSSMFTSVRVYLHDQQAGADDDQHEADVGKGREVAVPRLAPKDAYRN